MPGYTRLCGVVHVASSQFPGNVSYVSLSGLKYLTNTIEVTLI